MPISRPRRPRANAFDIVRTDRDEPAALTTSPKPQTLGRAETTSAPQGMSPRTRSERSVPAPDLSRRASR